jgi:DNA polymerase III epsilon subunit-like protein
MQKNYIFYDLETNGLDYYTTAIMQMTMLDINANIILNQYVYPFNNKIDATHIHGIDEQKLIDNNAIKTPDLCVLIKKLIRDIYGRDEVYFIAYNNFGYDQIILENNFKACNIKMPNNWYFIDIYPIIKELYPTMKPNYKLKTVFENICGVDESINFHCALTDTKCLYEIYKKIEDKYDFFIKYRRSLLQSDQINYSPISSLNGYHPNMMFERKNINTIGDIYIIFKNCACDNKRFEIYLRNNVGLYSNYLINNVIKQLNAIQYLQC